MDKLIGEWSYSLRVLHDSQDDGRYGHIAIDLPRSVRVKRYPKPRHIRIRRVN